MTSSIVLLIIIILAAMVLFSIEVLPAEVVALGVVLALIISGILPVDIAFQGFGSDTSIMILGLLILTAALVRTGVVQRISRAILLRIGENFNQLYWIITGTAGIMSAFISNTATSALFTPMTIGLARKFKIHPSKLLMSLAFATILASSVTLIGTSTNVVVSGLLQQQGLEPLGMFELTPIGIPILVVGLLYMFFIGRHLVPVRDLENKEMSLDILSYVSEFEVTPESPWAGKSIGELDLGKAYDLTVLQIMKPSGLKIDPKVTSVFQPGDKVLFEGNRNDLVALEDREIVKFTGEFKESSEMKRALSMAEVILLPGSPLLGRTLAGLNFRDRFGVQVLGINRNGETIRRRISQTRLKIGDQLLLQGNPDSIGGLGNKASFRVVTVNPEIPSESNRALLALAIFLISLLLAAFEILSLPVAVTLGAFAVFVTRCITPEEAYGQINWSLWLLISCMLALGQAMEVSGLADMIANFIVTNIGTSNPIILLSIFFFISLFLTQPMSNQAAAVVVIPIAIQAANHLGLNPRTFAMMIAIGASCSFITPLEPAAMIVYSAGNYRFFDFIKVGSLLTILIYLLAIVMVPWLWPL